MIESVVPFCPPDDNLPGWVERLSDALSASITGSGIAHINDIEMISDWFILSQIKNLQVAIVSAFPRDGYWSGAAVLSTFGITAANRRERAQFECTILSTADWSWHTTT